MAGRNQYGGDVNQILRSHGFTQKRSWSRNASWCVERHVRCGQNDFCRPKYKSAERFREKSHHGKMHWMQSSTFGVDRYDRAMQILRYGADAVTGTDNGLNGNEE
jgi:hypothetical protein